MSKRNININPKYWGNSIWRFIELCCDNFCVHDCDKFLKFMYLLKFVIPCEKCRRHYSNFYDAHQYELINCVNRIDKSGVNAWIEACKGVSKKRVTRESRESKFTTDDLIRILTALSVIENEEYYREVVSVINHFYPFSTYKFINVATPLELAFITKQFMKTNEPARFKQELFSLVVV